MQGKRGERGNRPFLRRSVPELNVTGGWERRARLSEGLPQNVTSQRTRGAAGRPRARHGDSDRSSPRPGLRPSASHLGDPSAEPEGTGPRDCRNPVFSQACQIYLAARYTPLSRSGLRLPVHGYQETRSSRAAAPSPRTAGGAVEGHTLTGGAHSFASAEGYRDGL